MRESMLLVPTVVEQTSQGERSFDIYSRLLRDNCCFSKRRTRRNP